MERQMMEQRLWRNRSDRARLEYLQRCIPLMRERLERLKADELQAIGRAPAMDAVRRGGVGDPTAALALKAAEYTLTDEMRLCAAQLRRMAREAAELEAQLAITDFLLATLPDESRFLLTQRCIEHTRWQDLTERYQARYGVYLSGMSLRRHMNQALDALCQTGQDGHGSLREQ